MPAVEKGEFLLLNTVYSAPKSDSPFFIHAVERDYSATDYMDSANANANAIQQTVHSAPTKRTYTTQLLHTDLYICIARIEPSSSNCYNNKKDMRCNHATQHSLSLIVSIALAFTAIGDIFYTNIYIKYWFHGCPSLVGCVPLWREAPPATLRYHGSKRGRV